MSTPPTFEGTAHVSDTSSSPSIWWMLAIVFAVSVAYFHNVYRPEVIGRGDGAPFILMAGWVGTMLALAIAGIIATVLRSRYSTAPARFSGDTSVRVDAQGFQVERFGTVLWSDMLALEGIPDSRRDMIVHTLGSTLLIQQIDVPKIAPVINFYLAAYENTTREMAVNVEAGPYFFKAQPFHWPTLFGFILSGYVVGIVVLGSMLRGSHELNLSMLAGPLITAAMSAYGVWFLPLMRLKLHRGGIRAYQHGERWLSAPDGSVQVDLSAAKVRRCLRSGLGYELHFITVAPAKGRRIDLLMSPPDIHVLTMHLRAAGIVVEADPPQLERPNPPPKVQPEPRPISTEPVDNPFL